jgi:Tfp pilus assembly PilM family ATPase
MTMVRFLSQRETYSPIGVDLGRRGVRLVQLARQRIGRSFGPWRLFRTFCWDWSPEATPERPDGGDARLTAALRTAAGVRELANRLQRFHRQNAFHGRDVVVGLSSPEVELHALELPFGSDAEMTDELRQAAHWEVERLMSFAQGTAASDFWMLPSADGGHGRRGKAESTGQPSAIGVVTEQAVVDAVWNLSRAAGLFCRRLDAGPCALSRCGVWLRSQGPGAAGRTSAAPAREIWGVLDLGDHQIRLILCVRDVPVLVRGFDTGGARWTRRLCESLGLSFSAAEIHLRDYGVQTPPRGRADEHPPGGSTRPAAAPVAHLGGIIRNILRDELEALAGETERSYRYALQCYPDHQGSELILVGAGAELPGLDAFLRERLGIPVQSAAHYGRPPSPESAGGQPAPGGGRAEPGRYPLGRLCEAIGLAIPPGVAPPGSVAPLPAVVAGRE